MEEVRAAAGGHDNLCPGDSAVLLVVLAAGIFEQRGDEVDAELDMVGLKLFKVEAAACRAWAAGEIDDLGE